MRRATPSLFHPLVIALAALALPLPSPAKLGETGAPPPAELLARLSPEVAAAARDWVRISGKDARNYGALSPQDLENEVVIALAADPRAADFTLSRLGHEPDATTQEILKVIGYETFWAGNARAVDTLRALGRTAPDPDLTLAYLDTARRIETKELRLILAARIAQARAGSDLIARNTLETADDRWVLLVRGAALPSFMRRPPAVFGVVPSGRPVRVVGLGDFGTGSEGQRQVAASIVRLAAAKPFDLGITFGDNFYQTGMASTEDPRWKGWWEDLYGPAHTTFYPSLGNHEWYSDEGAAAEIAYHSPTWRFPAPYYAYTAGPVEFFVVDTTDISAAQASWLDRAIAASTSRWKVVYGHHPLFAPDKDGKALRYMEEMQAHFWPILRGRVDAYLCGHQHVMAHMAARDGVHFFMSGGGGAPLGKVYRKADGVTFAEPAYGFMTLEADDAHLTATLYDAAGTPTEGETLTKG